MKHFTYLLLAAVALSAACDVTIDDYPSTGGTSNASGGNGQTSGTGGQVSTAGGAPSDGGAGGFAGAAGAPSCACFSESTITIELPSGTRVYDLASDAVDGCNPLTCEPSGPSGSWTGAPPNSYAMRGCRAEGDCIWLRGGSVYTNGTDGRFTIEEGGEVVIEEPITIEAALVDADRHQVVEFSFETNTESSIVASGSGSVCWASSNYICLK